MKILQRALVFVLLKNLNLTGAYGSTVPKTTYEDEVEKLRREFLGSYASEAHVTKSCKCTTETEPDVQSGESVDLVTILLHQSTNVPALKNTLSTISKSPVITVEIVICENCRLSPDVLLSIIVEGIFCHFPGVENLSVDIKGLFKEWDPISMSIAQKQGKKSCLSQVNLASFELTKANLGDLSQSTQCVTNILAGVFGFVGGVKKLTVALNPANIFHAEYLSKQAEEGILNFFNSIRNPNTLEELAFCLPKNELNNEPRLFQLLAAKFHCIKTLSLSVGDGRLDWKLAILALEQFPLIEKIHLHGFGYFNYRQDTNLYPISR